MIETICYHEVHFSIGTVDKEDERYIFLRKRNGRIIRIYKENIRWRKATDKQGTPIK